MRKRDGYIEARLAPVIIGLMFLAAVISIDFGIVVLLLSSYSSCRQCTPGDNFDFYLLLLTAVLAGFLFTLAYTWRLRILPIGVEVRFLCVRKMWPWNDFLEAEAGQHQIYFRKLPPWKRYLGCGFLDPVTAKQIWGMLLERVPPVKKLSGPLTLETWPRSRFTFLEEGIRVRRYFHTRFFLWDDLSRALVFQSPLSERGFMKLHLIFDKQTYRFTNVRAFRDRDESPTRYDVLDFLISHLPEEKLVFIDPYRLPRSRAEYEERKKIAGKMNLACILLGVQYAAIGCLWIYDQSDLMCNHGGVLTVHATLAFLGSIFLIYSSLMLWRAAWKGKDPLNKMCDKPGSNP